MIFGPARTLTHWNSTSHWFFSLEDTAWVWIMFWFCFWGCFCSRLYSLRNLHRSVSLDLFTTSSYCWLSLKLTFYSSKMSLSCISSSLMNCSSAKNDLLSVIGLMCVIVLDFVQVFCSTDSNLISYWNHAFEWVPCFIQRQWLGCSWAILWAWYLTIFSSIFLFLQKA